MTDKDLSYFYKRAETELEQAQRAQHPRAVLAHYELAEAYIARATSQRSKASKAQAR